MTIEKIAGYLFISTITFFACTIGSIIFGTTRFVKVLAKVEARLIELNIKLIKQIKEVDDLQRDLQLKKQSIQCKKCSCIMQSSSIDPNSIQKSL